MILLFFHQQNNSAVLFRAWLTARTSLIGAGWIR